MWGFLPFLLFFFFFVKAMFARITSLSVLNYLIELSCSHEHLFISFIPLLTRFICLNFFALAAGDGKNTIKFRDYIDF